MSTVRLFRLGGAAFAPASLSRQHTLKSRSQFASPSPADRVREGALGWGRAAPAPRYALGADYGTGRPVTPEAVREAMLEVDYLGRTL